MAVAWYIVPMARRVPVERTDEESGLPLPPDPQVRRYCQMDDFTADLAAVGGRWAAVEVLGQRAIVRVVAPQAALNQLANVAGFRRLPQRALDLTIGDLSLATRQAIRAELEAMGYGVGEIIQDLGAALMNVTLRQVLRFAARRRRKVRYDAEVDAIVDDGAIVMPSPTIEELEAALPEA